MGNKLLINIEHDTNLVCILKENGVEIFKIAYDLSQLSMEDGLELRNEGIMTLVRKEVTRKTTRQDKILKLKSLGLQLENGTLFRQIGLKKMKGNTIIAKMALMNDEELEQTFKYLEKMGLKL